MLTPKQCGENAHIEYTWSTNLKERMVQFFYQCNRCEAKRVAQLSNILKELLTSIGIDKPYHLNILYRMIGHTRDIVNGKGEYTLSYMMINVWYDFYPELAKHAFTCFVKLEDSQPYGSWKDIKYFCQYCLDSGRDIRHPLILYALSLLNTQLKTDLLNKSDDKISLVAKWIPREDSKFGQFYEILAVDYFNEITLTAYDDCSREKATLKCKTKYRKIISALNKRLKTVQINQCENTWANINFNEVTSVTLAKNRKAFLNKRIGGETKYPDNKDRTTCADNLNTYIENRVEYGLDIKGKHIGLELFTSTAIDLINREKSGDNNIQSEKDLLNLQWKNNASQNSELNNCIALIDISESMYGEPMYVANALGIRISEKSKLGKRIMTFDNKPRWINLEKCDDFVSMTKLICKDAGPNTNFYAALELILDAIIETKLKPEEVSDLTLIILSDMQMACTVYNNSQPVYDAIEQKYKEAGIKLYNKPFHTPHIVFWNLRSTDGFPVLSLQKNASMITGFNPVLLNTFCKEGTSTFRSCTPFDNLEKMVMNKRYDYLGYKISTNI
uniref:TROVE domain-containing protein n=1 Tax=viral metagenome TaxID=1070528 RepID=A0A6C0LN09_9ZZZZ